MKEQIPLLLNENWNNLIILDACRYDYFEKLYEKYLKGNLLIVKSPASCTWQWLDAVFGREKLNEVIYVSANPFTHSSVAEDFAHKMIDVWDEGWDSALNTVPPREVRKFTVKARMRYPGKKIVSHFMQPHIPYLSLEMDQRFAFAPNDFREGLKDRSGVKGSIFRFSINLAENLIGKKRIDKLAMKIGIKGGPCRVANKYGDEELKKAYQRNLEIVLKEVKKLVTRLPGKIVITSDHGELLGENNLYGHPPWSDHLNLKQIPWFVCE